MSALRRLYRGETNIDFIGYRKRWYVVSAVIIVICLASIIFRGFHFGIEFAGGNQFQVPAKPGVTLQDVRGAVDVASSQTAGAAGARRYVIRTSTLSDDQRNAATAAIERSAHVTKDEIALNEVSSSWGDQVTNKALIALVVFLLAVGVYIWVRFEQKMAIAALGALAHDLLLTAGIYSIVGFEVTPGTVIGLLVIATFFMWPGANPRLHTGAGERLAGLVANPTFYVGYPAVGLGLHSIPLAIALLALSGCADPLEQRSGQEVQEQFGRGITGQGTVGPMDRAPDDPAAEHSVPQTHP